MYLPCADRNYCSLLLFDTQAHGTTRDRAIELIDGLHHIQGPYQLTTGTFSTLKSKTFFTVDVFATDCGPIYLLMLHD